MGLQRVNRDLLQVVLAVTGCTTADTPDECRAKVAAASTAEGARRVAQVRADMQAITDQAAARIIHCDSNFLAALAGRGDRRPVVRAPAAAPSDVADHHHVIAAPQPHPAPTPAGHTAHRAPGHHHDDDSVRGQVRGPVHRLKLRLR